MNPIRIEATILKQSHNGAATTNQVKDLRFIEGKHIKPNVLEKG